ncbi:hypothetical protein [Blastococcus sp. Marseille-P5729]|uniref:hypothetical protein n=1 Tax=Blastococcus sp. Marseille-P5729 TaxID=2086582 RepID=UPI000D0E50EE|nr:hypothetical protein [Blastococcus sp. Marseille-P5729]
MREVLGKLAWAVIGLAAVLLVGYAVLMFYLSDTLDKEGESAGSDAASSTAGSSTPALTPAAELQTASCTDLDALMQQHLPDLTAAAQSNGEEHVLLHLECDNVAGELAVDSAIGYQPGWSDAVSDLVAVTDAGGPPGAGGHSGDILLSFDGTQTHVVIETSLATDRAEMSASVKDAVAQLADLGVVDPQSKLKRI